MQTEMRTDGYRLLLDCPDGQIGRMRAMYTCLLQGDTQSAACFLKNAIAETSGDWTENAQWFVDYLESK